MNKDIIFALLLIFNFSVIMLLVWQIAKKYSMTEQDKTVKPRQKKHILQLLVPQFVLLTGAVSTRLSGYIFLPFILAIVISMGITAANTYYLADYKFVQEAGKTGRIGYVLTRLIPSVFLYFFFLFAACGFNFERMRNLFTAK